MEVALKNLIENNIPELKEEICSTNAPEEATRLYLVYTRISTKKLKTLEGIQNKS